ncbi:MAG: tetratricopeptide repeat protein [Caldilineaceae bacterium]
MSLIGNLSNAEPARLALAAEIHFNLGTIGNFQSNYSAAHAHDEEALRLARLSGDRHLEAISLNNLGAVAEHSGRFDAAVGYFEQALAIFEDIGYQRGAANCLSNIGAGVSWRGELRNALARHRGALRVYQEIGDIGGEGWSFMAMGSILFHLGRLDEARTSLDKALQLNREGTLTMDTWASFHMAEVTLGQGELDEARRWIEQSFTLAQSMDDEMGVADAELLWGQLELRLGQGEAAKQRFERVLSIKRKHGHAQGEVSAQVALSSVALTAGDTPGALSYVEAALSVPDTAHLLLPRAPAVTQHGRVLAAAGKVAAAETAFAEALAMRRQMTQPHHVAAVRAWQARLFLESDHLDEARRAAEDVLACAWSASRQWTASTIPPTCAQLSPTSSTRCHFPARRMCALSLGGTCQQQKFTTENTKEHRGQKKERKQGNHDLRSTTNGEEKHHEVEKRGTRISGLAGQYRQVPGTFRRSETGHSLLATRPTRSPRHFCSPQLNTNPQSLVPSPQSLTVDLDLLRQALRQVGVRRAEDGEDRARFFAVGGDLSGVPVRRRRLEIDDAVGQFHQPYLMWLLLDAVQAVGHLLGFVGRRMSLLKAETPTATSWPKRRHVREGDRRVLDDVVEQRTLHRQIGVIHLATMRQCRRHLHRHGAHMHHVGQRRPRHRLHAVRFGCKQPRRQIFLL